MAPRLAAPRTSRLTLVFALAPACLLLSSPRPAEAGHYTGPTYAGGSVTYSPPGVTLPYGLANGKYGGGMSGNTSVICSGEITATFVWAPDGPTDLPPDQVVVQEWCDAWGHGFAAARPASAADNGIGFDPVIVEPPGYDPFPPMYSTSRRAQGTRYRVMQGQTTLPITCSPCASCTGGGTGNHEATVWYTCAVAPVTIELYGGLGPSYAKRYLVGLPVTATLSTGGVGPVPDANGCAWSCSAGKPFKDYTPNDTNSNYVPLVLSVERGTTLGFYFGEGREAGQGFEGSMMCEATLAVPPGCLPTGGLPVRASRNCSVEEPSIWSVFAAGTTGLGLRPPNPNEYLQPREADVFANDHRYTGVGTLWAAKVITPADWVSPYGQGTFTFVQTITWDASFQRWPDAVAFDYNLNGRKVLDVGFTYPFVLTLTSTPPDYFAGPAETEHVCDGTWLMSCDTPGIELNPDGVLSTNFGQAMETYVLYKPGGADSRYVPLERWPWSWRGVAVRQADRTYVGSGYVSPSVVGQELHPDHPMWSENSQGGHFVQR